MSPENTFDGTNLRRRFKPVQFFSLDFALTWGPLWLAVWLTSTGKIAFNNVFMAFAAISATLAAIIIIYLSKDRQLIKAYWNRVYNIGRIGLGWWPILIFMLPVINVIAIAISTFFGHSAMQFQLNEALLTSPMSFVLLLLFYGPVPEELGWRGYGLDSLRTRFTLLNSSLMLALFWSIWHISLFLPARFLSKSALRISSGMHNIFHRSHSN